MPDPTALAQPLETLVRQAGSIAQEARATMSRTLKPDGSIVTSADQDAERFLRAELTRLLPGSRVWGEEEGHADPGPEGLWLVDPIDGTSNFAFGSPLWGVSVALLVGEHVEVGVVALSDLDEVYVGLRGAGAWCNAMPLPRPSPGPIRREELVSYSDGLIHRFPGVVWPGKMRHSGAFVVDAMFVARGRMRGLIDYKCKLYDIAASLVVCGELGYDIRYASGEPFVLRPLLADRPVGQPFVIFPPDSGFIVALA
ncbi:MAG TPA: inositol monophosphatase family protein [Fimbriimonadaceae bacterium]|nr:inositol monophosphatase family protein [Fimbriimonadaceae bacterium]